MSNLNSKLLKIQQELKAPKSQYNSFGKYNYRNCEDILEALKPLCAKNGTVLTISDTIVQVGDRYYVRAEAALEDVETCEIKKVTASAREEETKKGMDASQITGSASSYARKYALNGLFAIDDTEDADAHEDKPEQPPKGKQQPKKSQQAIISDLIKDTSITPAEVAAYLQRAFAGRRINDLSEIEFKKAYKDIKEEVDNERAKM